MSMNFAREQSLLRQRLAAQGSPIVAQKNQLEHGVEAFCIDSNGKLIVLERGHILKNLGFTNSEKDLNISFPDHHFNNVACFGSYIFVAGFHTTKTKTFSQTEHV